MSYKLLVLHTNGVITAVLLLPVLDSAVKSVCVAIDPAKDHAYRAANAGKTVTHRAYEEAVGRFEKRLVIVDPNGAANDHPADSLLLGITKLAELPDILAHAMAGKYIVKNKKIEPNPAWQEPTMVVVPPTGG